MSIVAYVECGRVLAPDADVLWGPFAAARSQGFQGLAEGLALAAASLLLNPASGIMELGSLAARGWEQELMHFPFSQQRFLVNYRQLLLEQLLRQIRSEKTERVTSRSRETHLERTIDPAVSAATAAATVLTVTSQAPRLPLPRLLCGQWHMLRRMDPEDSLVQLVLIRLEEFHRFPYSAHMLDRRPEPAAADLAAALAGGSLGPTYAPGESEGQRLSRSPACSRGLVLLLLLGSKCVLLVGWPLGPVLVFESSLIGCIHVTKDAEGTLPGCCAALVAIELSKTVQRQIHLRSSAAAAISGQNSPTPAGSPGGWDKPVQALQAFVNLAFNSKHNRAPLEFGEDDLGMRTHDFFNIVDLRPEDPPGREWERGPPASPGAAGKPLDLVPEPMESATEYLTPRSSFTSIVADRRPHTQDLWQGLRRRAAKWLLLQVMAST